MTAKTLMMMGTSSSAGKSLLTAAACRCFARRGFRVAPFKSQNMSNNAAVCRDGGEIGRSQALQAMAARTEPTTDMNPVLLKPEGDCRSQVIVHGRPAETLSAVDYYKNRDRLWGEVTGSLDRLRQKNDLVVIEGAGSPAELNLADVEIVNMSVAKYCQSTVLLIGDIERGGVFAQLLGTLWLLPPEEGDLIQGLIVNKFRGDLSLFDSGTQILEDRGGVPVLGVLPWVHGLDLPEEDAVALSSRTEPNGAANADGCIDIAVIQLPHISNFDDFDPLGNDPSVCLRYVQNVGQWGNPDVVILPGTKNTLGDLKWLHTVGLAEDIVQAAGNGTHVVGICGGYQMLGRRLSNHHQVENDVGSADGLGLLESETTFANVKETNRVRCRVTDDAIAPGCSGEALEGYEIHNGRTVSQTGWMSRLSNTASSVDDSAPLSSARSANARVWGCYLHGIFHNDRFRQSWLESITGGLGSSTASNANHSIEKSLDLLADAFENHIDMNQLEKLIGLTPAGERA